MGAAGAADIQYTPAPRNPRITLDRGTIVHSQHGTLDIQYGRFGVKIGCTFVSYEVLKEINKRFDNRPQHNWDY